MLSPPVVPLQRTRIRRLAMLCVLVPLAFGLLSLLLGQDRNWDLRNYHLYNAYAWLTGRGDRDLAVAGMQSYFNPLLDVPYYWLNRWMAPPWIGFLMGWLQGLNFVLLLGIARRLLPHPTRLRVAVALALGGCLMAGFLSELGNTMGDNITALPVLAAVLLASPRGNAAVGMQAWPGLLLAGLLMGVAVGLKLTNAIFAVGMLGALPCQRHGATGRVQAPMLFAAAAAAGLAMTSGYWFWHLWSAYGNPLFPQFSALFPNPLTAPINVADTRHLPRSVLEWVLWPLLIALDPRRIGELPLHQLAWPVLYLLLLWWAARATLQRLRGASDAGPGSATRFLACFVGLGFLVWMGIFGISRYLVVLELLSPLLIWLLIRECVPGRHAGRLARWTVAAVVLVGLPGYLVNWGHAGWSNPAFVIDPPAINASDAATGTVLIVGQEIPQAWMATLLPASLSFIGVDNSFTAGAGFDRAVHQRISRRGGPLWAVLPAAQRPRRRYVTRLNRIADGFGLTDDPSGCQQLARWHRRLKLSAQLETAEDGRHCAFTLRDTDRVNLAPLDRATAQRLATQLRARGIVLDPASCQRHAAAIGTQPYPFQWCRAKLAYR